MSTSEIMRRPEASPPSAALAALQQLLGQRSRLASDLDVAQRRLVELETELEKHVAAVPGLSSAKDGERSLPDHLSPLLSEVERVALEVTTLRGGSEQLEQRIAVAGDGAFEEMQEPLPTTLAPILRQVMSPATPEREVFRLLRVKVQSLNAARRLKCVGIVSAAPSEGKTTAALGLALSMAGEQGRRVLLIEADLRRPTVERYLGLPRRVGLGDWLRGECERLRMRRLDPPGLHLLTAGTPGGQAAELLRSTRMAQLVDVARQSFDLVIFDCPPPAPLADAVILQDLIDGFLLVVRGRYTPREEIREALANLKPESIRGVIFNDYSQILPRLYSRGRDRYEYYYLDPDKKR